MPQLLKPDQPRTCALQQEKPWQCEVHTLQLEGSLYSRQLEKARVQQQRSSAVKNITNLKEINF